MEGAPVLTLGRASSSERPPPGSGARPVAGGSVRRWGACAPQAWLWKVIPERGPVTRPPVGPWVGRPPPCPCSSSSVLLQTQTPFFSQEEAQKQKELAKAEIQKILKEKEQLTADLSSMEKSFSDLFKRFEKQKEVIEGYRTVGGAERLSSARKTPGGLWSAVCH